jgi:hypothetical protein
MGEGMCLAQPQFCHHCRTVFFFFFLGWVLGFKRRALCMVKQALYHLDHNPSLECP